MSTHEDFSRKLELKGPSDRSFGWVFVVFLLFLGLWPALRGRPVRLWALPVAAAILVITLVRPGLLHTANVLWMKFGLLLSKVMNPVVTALLYYVVFTPVGMLMRLAGKRPLPLGFDRAAQSYWIERRPPGPKPESMSQQF